MIDLNKYEVCEVVRQEDSTKGIDERLEYLSKTINDRAISERSKVLLQDEMNKLMKMKYIATKPPVILLKER